MFSIINTITAYIRCKSLSAPPKYHIPRVGKMVNRFPAIGLDKQKEMKMKKIIKKYFIKKYIIPEFEKMKNLQRSTCDCVKDSYYRGLYNGIELMAACFANRETEYIDAPKHKK
jgi:hypothetical protein